MIEYITAGESHGKGMIVIIKGIPSNLIIDENFINSELSRRQKGYGRGARMKIETDKVEILSGVWKGKTTGSPITIVIWNKDYENWKDKAPTPILEPRPGHADLIGGYKFNHLDDLRKVLERSSARETAARVAGGSLVKLLLKEFGIEIFSHVVNWGGIEIDTSHLPLEEIKNLAFQSEIQSACDKTTEERVKKLIDEAKQNGDTVGGIIEVIVNNVPPFLGSYQTYQEKLDAKIAEAVLSIQAVKGIEFGLGFKYAYTSGKKAHDEIFYDGKYYRKTNNAGGIEGGMSNGSPIVFRAVMKPIPTLMSPLSTVNISSKEKVEAIKERSDVTAVGACGVVIENSIAFVIANALISRYGGDDLNLIKENFNNDKSLKYFR
ncbi:MAG: chorismate synthase [Brevinematales bacterium]|nr:chorismate synthase [Brevinematales bacterium]